MRKLAVVVLLFTAFGLFAQGRPKPEAQIAAMAKLDYMIGNWEGTGWIEMGGPRLAFRGSELVQRKLDGTALLVEGAHFAKPPGAPAEIPVHTTMAVIAYDAAAKKYTFDTWLATGASGDHELVLHENGWHWDIKPPMGGTIRYTMTLTDKGEWLEIGEMLKDGAEPRKFFEMRLTKK